MWMFPNMRRRASTGSLPAVSPWHSPGNASSKKRPSKRAGSFTEFFLGRNPEADVDPTSPLGRSRREMLATSSTTSLSRELDLIVHAEPSSELKKEFYNHLRFEHSPEHLEFLQHVDLFKSEHACKSASENRARAQFIFHHFADRRGTTPVNISSDLADALKARIQDLNQPIPADIFDRAEKEIRQLLELDALTRFVKTPAYRRASLEANAVG